VRAGSVRDDVERRSVLAPVQRWTDEGLHQFQYLAPMREATKLGFAEHQPVIDSHFEAALGSAAEG
jgi:hypothetical protein